MKIIQLEYFCAVSRYHSITQAAQKLFVTQPAISTAIKELEKEFSVNLFVRSKNHLTLTTEGEIFYQKAQELLQSIDQTTQQLYDLGKQTPSVRICIWIFKKNTRTFHWNYPSTVPSAPPVSFRRSSLMLL